MALPAAGIAVLALGGCAVLAPPGGDREAYGHIAIVEDPGDRPYTAIRTIEVVINALSGNARKSDFQLLLRREAHKLDADAVINTEYDIRHSQLGDFGVATGVAVRWRDKERPEPNVPAGRSRLPE